jgi:hypothetical protein
LPPVFAPVVNRPLRLSRRSLDEGGHVCLATPTQQLRLGKRKASGWRSSFALLHSNPASKARVCLGLLLVLGHNKSRWRNWQRDRRTFRSSTAVRIPSRGQISCLKSRFFSSRLLYVTDIFLIGAKHQQTCSLDSKWNRVKADVRFLIKMMFASIHTLLDVVTVRPILPGSGTFSICDLRFAIVDDAARRAGVRKSKLGGLKSKFRWACSSVG